MASTSLFATFTAVVAHHFMVHSTRGTVLAQSSTQSSSTGDVTLGCDPACRSKSVSSCAAFKALVQFGAAAHSLQSNDLLYQQWSYSK